MALNLIGLLADFLDSAKRIFVISKKPDRQEFAAMLKATAIGTVVIAVVGFIVFLFFAFTGLGK